MFNTLNSRYQRLLTSTVEISIYVVKIISFYFLLYKIHIDMIIHILRKKLSRIYNMNTCNTYVFEHLLHAGSCSRCFIMKFHGRNKNRELRAYRKDVHGNGVGRWEGGGLLEVKT